MGSGSCYGTNPSFPGLASRVALGEGSMPVHTAGQPANAAPLAHMACPSRLGVRFLMSWSQSPSPPQLQAANVSCRLFICSIREIPGDVNGAPYAEHVPSMGPGSRVLTLDFMPTWLAVWKPLPAIKFLFLIPIRWLGWGPENPQLEVPLGIIPLMQLI